MRLQSNVIYCFRFVWLSLPGEPNRALQFHFLAFKWLSGQRAAWGSHHKWKHLSFNTSSGKPVANIVSPWQNPAYLLVLVINVCTDSSDSGLSAAVQLLNPQTAALIWRLSLSLDDTELDEMSLIQQHLCHSLCLCVFVFTLTCTLVTRDWQ